MSVSVGEVIRESIDRGTTTAGAALFGILLAVQFLQTVASHNQGNAREQFEQSREQLQNSSGGGGDFEAFFEVMEPFVASQEVFAVGIPSGAATILGYLLFAVALVVQIAGIFAIANRHDRLAGSVLDGMGWKVANAIGGGILLAIAFGILMLVIGIVVLLLSFIPFVGPIIALVLLLALGLAIGAALFYWLPAIAVDGQNALDALSTSVNVATDNIGSTVALVLLLGVLSVVNGLLFVGLLFGVGPTVATLLSLLTGAATSLVNVVVLGSAYDLADTGSDPPSSKAGDQEWSREREGDGPGETTEQWGSDTADDSRHDSDGDGGTDTGDDWQ